MGLIEGVGEATASISKLFSGWLSDRLGKRKALTVIGYGLVALSKPIFALASRILRFYVASRLRIVRWTPETGQVAKRESSLGVAVRPKVRHDQYAKETRA